MEYDVKVALEESSFVEVQRREIAKKVLRYYFEQTMFFDLQQSSNPVKWFKSNIESLCNKEYEKAVNATIKVLKTDVSYRFLRVESKEIEGVYQYEKKADSL